MGRSWQALFSNPALVESGSANTRQANTTSASKCIGTESVPIWKNHFLVRNCMQAVIDGDKWQEYLDDWAAFKLQEVCRCDIQSSRPQPGRSTPPGTPHLKPLCEPLPECGAPWGAADLEDELRVHPRAVAGHHVLLLFQGLVPEAVFGVASDPCVAACHRFTTSCLMTRWVGEAYEEALSKLNIPGGFTSLGYLFVGDASYHPKVRDMAYQFTPSQFPAPPRNLPPPKAADKQQRQPRLEEMFRR